MPTAVPAHDPENHSQLAPVPNEPPVTVKVEEFPSHITKGVALAAVGSVESVFTVTVMLWQIVLLQVPSALTK